MQDEQVQMIGAEDDVPADCGVKLYSQEELDCAVGKARADADAAVAERERDIRRRELRLDVRRKLADAGLPARLADCVNYSSPEDCDASFDAVSAAFAESVSKSVAGYIGSHVPARADVTKTDAFLAGLGMPALY